MSGAPLSETTVLVTRPAKQTGGLAEPLQTLGATVYSLPSIEIAPPLDFERLDRALGHLDRYDWVVVTSVNGVEALRSRAATLDVRADVCGRRLAAVGPSTASAMREAFREPDFVPQEYTGEAIAGELGDVAGQRFFLARADIARKDLPEKLREKGALVDDLVAYRIVRPVTEVELPDQAPDWIALTSSSGVVGTHDALTARGRGEWMRTCRLACIGPLAAATVREMGYEVAVMAEEHTIPGLVEAIVRATTPPLSLPKGRDDALSSSPRATERSMELNSRGDKEGLRA